MIGDKASYLTSSAAQAVPLHNIHALRSRLNSGKGRGIIISAGSHESLANAFVNLVALRETLECKLPVEIWYMAAEKDAVDEMRHTIQVDDVLFHSLQLADAGM